MSPQLEHDYITGAGVSPGLNLKETELRLGLPGSESPERKAAVGLTLELLLLPAKPGAKRGFSDAIDGNWGFSGGKSEVELGKGAALFSPRGAKDSAAAAAAGGGQMAKDSAAPSAAAAAGKGQDKQAPAAKAQVVGWPPIRSYRKNTLATNPVKSKEDAEAKQGCCLYVKVSMDGAPYLRKVDLKTYCNYKELSFALEKMFSGFTIGQCGGHGVPGQSEIRLVDVISGSEHVLTYEDKDGDWMLVGDVPWQMFTGSCRRLRIMKGSDAIGLAPRALDKCKNQN